MATVQIRVISIKAKETAAGTSQRSSQIDETLKDIPDDHADAIMAAIEALISKEATEAK